MEILTCFVWCLLILFYYVIKMEIKQLKRFFLFFISIQFWVETVLLHLHCKCISREIWFSKIQHVYWILVTSHFGYVELRIPRSISAIPLDFEITRLTCISKVPPTRYMYFSTKTCCGYSKELAQWEESFEHLILFVFVLFLLLYVPSQQLWSLRDGQFT